MKALKTCLFSLNNPVDIHPRPVPPSPCVDNETVIHTVFHKVINSVAKGGKRPSRMPPTAWQEVAFRPPVSRLSPRGCKIFFLRLFAL